MNLRFDHISYTYPGYSTYALKDVSITFTPQSRVALIGKNGGGKSTLMQLANGILRPDDGRLYFDEVPVQYDRASLLNLRRKVGVIFQNPDDQLFSASVYQDISLGPLNLGLTEEQAKQRVMQVAELCGLIPFLDRPTHALSGGEKARTALAGILAMQPLYLFADEITNSLDPWMRAQMIDILNQWVAQGHTVVLSTHDWQLARTWSQTVVWLDQGRVYQNGPTQEVLDDFDPFSED